MKRILLILPSTTYRTHDFMEAASRLGVQIVVGSDHRHSWDSLVPDTTVALDFRHPENIPPVIREFARRNPLDAVLGVDDLSVYIAAHTAHALELPHNPIEAVGAARNKLRMREKMAAAGLNTPAFRGFSIQVDPADVAERVRYPCVIKPLFLSASRGVVRADTPEQFVQAVTAVQALLADPEVRRKSYGDEAEYFLVEEYIPAAAEVAVEGLLIDREFKPLAIFDKPDPLEGPHFVETIYVTPSRLPGYVQREVIHAAHRAALALGLITGPVHAEVRVNEKGAWVVEIAARSIGGLCSRVLRFDEGMSLEELILRQALGEDVRSIQRERRAAGVMMLPIPREGVLEKVEGLEAAQLIPGVSNVIITIPPGEKVIPMPRGGRYLGFIFARAETPEAVEAALREAYAKLHVVVLTHNE